MSDHDDRIFAERLAQFAASADEADWDDVARRARHRGRTPVVAVVLASLLAVAVATPAFGLQRIVIDWFTTEPASPRIEIAFSTLDKGAPPGLETRVIPGTARKVFDVVLPEGVRARVWLAPTARAGFCELLQVYDADGSGRGAFGPGCDDRRNATGYGLAIPGPISPAGVIERGPVVIDGYATITDATTAVIRFQDGTKAEIRLTWVSKPIDAGFFVYGVRRTNWGLGRQPIELRYVDARGNNVSQTYTIRLGRR